MRMRVMKRVVFLGLMLASLAGTPTVGMADESTDKAKALYIDQVINILRAEVIAMRTIIDHEDMRYSSNLVRHADTFKDVFGMIGPMEWHAAEAANHMSNLPEAERLSKEQFEELAASSYQSVRGLKRAVNRYLRDNDKQRMHGAINTIIANCGSCHSKLPEGTAPHVWKGLKE